MTSPSPGPSPAVAPSRQPAARERLDYIDWMRGLACVLMFQTHGYDSWLAPPFRQTPFFGYSQLLGTFPAPLFLFLAGISLALGVDRMDRKGAAPTAIAGAFVRRGLMILGFGVLFRLQEYLIAYPWAPWTDLLRVDILNTIGISLALAGLTPLIARTRWQRVAASTALALAIALATPPLWTTHKPDFLPWWLASYINGGHTTYQPAAWLFPIFPWTAFTFAGAAVGFFLVQFIRLRRQHIAVAGLAAAGVVLWLLARWFDSLPVRVYAVYDYWHTSPNFFLARAGILLVILAACYLWCVAKPGRWWSPVQQLGMTSLLVYWVHIEFVYGRFSILPKGANSIPRASLGVAIIACSMLLLSFLRTSWKKRGADWLRKKS